MGIIIVSESRQQGWNPCTTNNGGCSHLCFHKLNNYTCDCPDDLTDGSCSKGIFFFILKSSYNKKIYIFPSKLGRMYEQLVLNFINQGAFESKMHIFYARNFGNIFLYPITSLFNTLVVCDVQRYRFIIQENNTKNVKYRLYKF